LKSLDTIEAASESDRRGDMGIMRVKVDTLKAVFQV